jgi:hypothetical protein
MEDLLRGKGLYWMSLGIYLGPIDAEKPRKWFNRNDETRGLIGMKIYEDLKFHIQSINIAQES